MWGKIQREQKGTQQIQILCTIHHKKFNEKNPQRDKKPRDLVQE